MSKKQRDEAIERVGHALYGQYWIGVLGTREWKISKTYKAESHPTAELPQPGTKAAAVATACFRSKASDLQNAQVFRWLSEQGINCEPHRFDAVVFDAWLAKKFPSAAPSTTSKRVNAVRTLLREGHQPGRGGNIVWEKFGDLARKRSGLRFDNKTIKRDVQKIRVKS